jgi:hypothetical protein
MAKPLPTHFESRFPELAALGWASCQPDGKPPCLHHPYWDLNDWHSVEDARERSEGKEERMLLCVDGKGPDWAGYADEYDASRLTERERTDRASAARHQQGFLVPDDGVPPTASAVD